MSAEKGCPNCGIELPDIAAVCPCGYNMDDDESGTPGPGSVRAPAGSQSERADGMMQPARAPAKAAPGKRASGTAAALTTPAPSAAPVGRPQPNRSMLMACPSCSASISRRAPVCPGCGNEPFRHCVVCAERIIANAAACPECGDPDPFVPPPA